tara:strand:+ start:992 stop:1141 length:150 start_codon:yes stop_codon:yes gene_type:complete
VNEFRFEATERGGELERMEKVVGLLEAATTGEELVDEILHAGDVESTKS